MKSPLISVIVPVYKVEQYLTRCIESIINQTYKNLEIILVDDGSPDSCPALCDNWAKKDKRIKVIHQKNSGVSSARNNGIEQATGNYIAFVDSDDWIEPETYETVLNKALSEDSDLTFFRYAYVDANLKKTYINEINLTENKLKQPIYFFLNSRKNEIHTDIMGSCARILIKKDIIANTRFRTDLKYCEDLMFVLEIISKTDKVSVVDKHFYNYFINENSVCRVYNNAFYDNLTKYYYAAKDYFNKNNLDLFYLINNKYLCKNVMTRIFNADFIKTMKNLVKNDVIFKNALNKKEYKKNQALEINKVSKVRNFLIYHKMWRTLRFLQKLRKSK